MKLPNATPCFNLHGLYQQILPGWCLIVCVQALKIERHSLPDVFNRFFIGVTLAMTALEGRAKSVIAALRFTLKDNGIVMNDFFTAGRSRHFQLQYRFEFAQR